MQERFERAPAFPIRSCTDEAVQLPMLIYLAHHGSASSIVPVSTGIQIRISTTKISTTSVASTLRRHVHLIHRCLLIAIDRTRPNNRLPDKGQPDRPPDEVVGDNRKP